MAAFTWNCLQVFLCLALDVALSRSQGFCRITLYFPSTESPLFPSSPMPPSTSAPPLETGEKPSFRYPEILSEDSQLLTADRRDPLVMTCPGKRNKKSKHVLAPVTCSRSGRVLYVNNKRAKNTDIVCKRRPRGTLLHTKTRCHGHGEGIIHVIGWSITEGWFIPQITVCWDKERETTLYTRHMIYGSFLQQRVASPGRPAFKPGKLYDGDVRSVFKRKSQLKNLGPVLGDGVRIPGTPDYYFARGHMAADADFVLPAEQDGTYFYSNVVPQFQSFNNGNWKRMERSVRELAQQKNHSFVVFTGTMGTLQLKDMNGNYVPIYLDPIKSFYPAPLIIWKVVYDRAENEAVALLGLNQLDNDDELLSYLFSLCDDICHLLPWAKWTSNNWKRGALSCCRWDQFEEYVPKMANFTNVRLLGF